MCDYNSKHTLWGLRLTTTKGRELSEVIQEKNYSFLSTGTPTYWISNFRRDLNIVYFLLGKKKENIQPTYWPTDGNKIPDLLDFFVTNGISSTYTDIQSSYDLTSDHSPVIATLSTSVIVRQPISRLHNSKTNWDTYRQIIQGKENLSIKLTNTKIQN